MITRCQPTQANNGVTPFDKSDKMFIVGKRAYLRNHGHTSRPNSIIGKAILVFKRFEVRIQ